MAKRTTQFHLDQTKELYKLLSGLASRGHDLGRVFDDFLTAVVCCLALGTAEERYLEMAKRYSEGEKGKRGIDIMAEGFSCLVNVMEETGKDILGDFFEGTITYGEAGQFFTPPEVCEVMAKLIDDGSGERVSDPACGSGRTLLAAARVNSNRFFVGQDVDERCVKMTAINLALNGLRGDVVWGNTLTLEEHGYYQVGLICPGSVQFFRRPFRVLPPEVSEPGIQEESQEKKKQLPLFAA